MVIPLLESKHDTFPLSLALPLIASCCDNSVMLNYILPFPLIHSIINIDLFYYDIVVIPFIVPLSWLKHQCAESHITMLLISIWPTSWSSMIFVYVKFNDICVCVVMVSTLFFWLTTNLHYTNGLLISTCIMFSTFDPLETSQTITSLMTMINLESFTMS